MTVPGASDLRGEAPSFKDTEAVREYVRENWERDYARIRATMVCKRLWLEEEYDVDVVHASGVRLTGPEMDEFEWFDHRIRNLRVNDDEVLSGKIVRFEEAVFAGGEIVCWHEKEQRVFGSGSFIECEIGCEDCEQVGPNIYIRSLAESQLE